MKWLNSIQKWKDGLRDIVTNIPWRTQLRAYLITGFLTILPVMATGFLIVVIMRILYKTLGEPFYVLVEKLLHIEISGIWLILFNILGTVLGLICVLGVIILIGILTASILGRTFFVWLETFLVRVPLVSNFYAGVKQLVEILFSKGKSSFTRVVLVEYPRKGVYSIGFVTAEKSPVLSDITDEEMVNIYLPTALNIASGFMIIAPVKDTIPLDISIEEGLKLVISGGFITPSSQKKIRVEGRKEIQ